jgi:hypothetical protein
MAAIGDLMNGKIIESNPDESPERKRTVTTLRIESIGGTVRESGRFVVEGTRTTLGDDLTQTDFEETHDFILDCGHLAKGRENVAGICFCGNVCCPACLSVCAEDGKLLCPKHRVIFKGKVLCPDCHAFAEAQEACPWL